MELDRLLARWGTASDPGVMEQMKRQRDEVKLREDPQRSRRTQGERPYPWRRFPSAKPSTATIGQALGKRRHGQALVWPLPLTRY